MTSLQWPRAVEVTSIRRSQFERRGSPATGSKHLVIDTSFLYPAAAPSCAIRYSSSDQSEPSYLSSNT